MYEKRQKIKEIKKIKMKIQNSKVFFFTRLKSRFYIY